MRTASASPIAFVLATVCPALACAAEDAHEPVLDVLVVAPDGTPIPDARVTVDRNDGCDDTRPCPTDDRGQARVFALEGLDVWAVKASHPDFVTGCVVGLDLDAGQELPTIKIELARGAGIAGRVLDEQGTPIAGAAVTARLTSPLALVFDRFDKASYARALRDSDYRRRGVVSGPDGAYAIGGLPAGTYKVCATKPGRLPAEAREVRVAGQEVAQGVVFALAKGLAVRGRVVDKAGAPIAGATVAASDVEARTDADGFFELAGFPKAQKEPVEVCAQGFARDRVELSVPGENARITLHRLASVAGCVRAPGITSWAEGRVFLSAVEATDGPGGASFVFGAEPEPALEESRPIDHAGRFALNVEGGRWQLAFVVPGFKVEYRTIGVALDQRIDGMTVDLGPPRSPTFLWTADAADDEADYYVAFRGTWEAAGAGEFEIRLLGASWFTAWLDGELFAEGPARFPVAFPEYQTSTASLPAGRHVLAVQVHHEGVPTRMLENQPPFLWCAVFVNGSEVPVRWKQSRIGGYAPRVRRVNPQLGWIEWCDTRQVPDWQAPKYDDTPWKPPVEVARKLGPLAPLSTEIVRAISRGLVAYDRGTLVETFGYEKDDPAARFFLRDLEAKEHPPQGVWRRYDLEAVCLFRPRFELSLPAGAIVEFAYSEALTRGRVAPWITLSAGDSCNLDHYVARGGKQVFFPCTPRGGRFLEVHVIAPPEKVAFEKEAILERCYYGKPKGAFVCGDALLERIWWVGAATHRACAEDALIDNPTRERGQWAGDVVSVGMDIAAAAFGDLRLCRRGLVQCAQCARADGLVAGMCPGQDVFLSTYAAQWVSACVHYWELTGDRTLLADLFPAAQKNIAAFEAQRTPEGLRDALGWGFVDWGYVRNPGPSDMAVNLHYLAALRDMVRWCAALGETKRGEEYERLAATVAETIGTYFAETLADDGGGWLPVGFHRAALGLRLGFFKGTEERACIGFLKAHILRCFPNDQTAPRLSDPAADNPRLVTPYFAHFVFGPLFERGEADFVLAQYRACWGWALGDDRTTWLEVFDTRWSHCHQWAGCPTWQLSRYVLGLEPRCDRGERCLVLALAPGSLRQAKGRVPIPGTGEAVDVAWQRTPEGLRYRLEAPVEIKLDLGTHAPVGSAQVVSVRGTYEALLR